MILNTQSPFQDPRSKIWRTATRIKMQPTFSRNISGIVNLAAIIPFYSSIWNLLSLPGDIPISSPIVCQKQQHRSQRPHDISLYFQTLKIKIYLACNLSALYPDISTPVHAFCVHSLMGRGGGGGEENSEKENWNISNVSGEILIK